MKQNEMKPVQYELEANIVFFEQLKEKNLDLVIREMTLGGKTKASLIYLDSLCDKNVINRDILYPLLAFNEIEQETTNLIENIRTRILTTGKIESFDYINEAVTKLLSGFSLLFINQYPQGLSIEVIGGVMRSITAPQMGSNYYSSADAFVEVILTNITLIRRKLRNENLNVMPIEIGEKNKRLLSVLYMEDRANSVQVVNITQKLKQLKTDHIIDLDDISKTIDQKKQALFPLCQRLERPDAVANLVANGKIAILCDEDPGCLIYPSTFYEMFKTSDDYATTAIFKNAIWWIRYFCFWVAILLPSLYIAIISFDPEILPTELVVAIAKSISTVPLPAVYEVYLVMFLVLIIKEASMNLPSKLGQTVSIVGGIILGQSLIAANLVSAPVVILITCSTIAQLVIPNYKIISTVNILSFFMVLLGSSFGLFGVIVGLFMIHIHLYSLNSLGEPYFSLKK